MTLVKNILKKIIPQSIRVALRNKQKTLRNITKPVNAKYIGNQESVLNCKIAYNQDGGFCLPLASLHRPAVQLILKGKQHEPDTIKFINANCKDGSVVHAGAYFGDLIPAISKGLSKHANLYSFEPSFENYRCAQLTCSINNLQNVELYHAALGETSGQINFQVEDESGKNLGGLSKVQIHKKNAAVKTEQVKVLTIDEVIPNDVNISIIHLDVEGYEQFSLAGAMETINRCLPIIIVETLPNEDWLKENLTALGYTKTGSLQGDTVFSIV